MDAFVLHVMTLFVVHTILSCMFDLKLPLSLCMLTAVGACFNMIGWLFCSEACVNGLAGPA
jgi:hypothetical protein